MRLFPTLLTGWKIQDGGRLWICKLLQLCLFNANLWYEQTNLRSIPMGWQQQTKKKFKSQYWLAMPLVLWNQQQLGIIHPHSLRDLLNPPPPLIIFLSTLSCTVSQKCQPLSCVTSFMYASSQFSPRKVNLEFIWT